MVWTMKSIRMQPDLNVSFHFFPFETPLFISEVDFTFQSKSVYPNINASVTDLFLLLWF